jgi:hypothetical protein
MSSETNSLHLSDWQAAAYVDGRMSPAERARLEDHLEECDLCRREVVDVARVVERPAEVIARPRRRVLVSGLGVAAAALAVLLFRPRVGVDVSRDQLREVETGAETEGVPRISAVRPANGAMIGATERAIVWRSAGSDATYRITLGDAMGGTLWRTETSDTSSVFPADVSMEPGVTYFWHVDALLPSGVSATTRVQSFTVRR